MQGGRIMKQNRTRTAIADAFTRLLAEHTIDRITVRMITDEVGCSRKTFYYYFTDIYDLTRYVCDQRVSAFLASNTDVSGAREGVQAFMQYLNAERSVVLNMFRGYGKEALERFTWQTIDGYTRRMISARPDTEGMAPEDLETVIHMYTYMLFGMMVDWVGNEMNADCTQTLDLAIRALPRIIEGLKK